MKKNIIFFASSVVDLMDLYLVLKSKFNIIWIVYHKGVYEFLKKENDEHLQEVGRYTQSILFVDSEIESRQMEIAMFG